MRDLSRAREDAKRAETRARQQLQAMLLRHDIRYPGKSAWSAPPRRWLADLKLPHPAQQIAFQAYVTAIDEAAERAHASPNRSKSYCRRGGCHRSARLCKQGAASH